MRLNAIAQQVKETPLLFKAPMVIATLEDRKTETRRLRGLELINENPDFWSVTWQVVEETSGRWAVQFDGKLVSEFIRCPYGAPGDRLWVKETFAKEADGRVVYFADNYEPETWRPSIFMPRWASRITLEITEVRVERLQEISAEACIAEGVEYAIHESTTMPAMTAYRILWDSINGKKHPWASNPWVWVISFKRIKP